MSAPAARCATCRFLGSRSHYGEGSFRVGPEADWCGEHQPGPRTRHPWIGLFIVREEGGLFEPVGLLTWLKTEAPIFGIRVGAYQLVYDRILFRQKYTPWRGLWRGRLAWPRPRPVNPHS